jgi:hypothetical protein
MTDKLELMFKMQEDFMLRLRDKHEAFPRTWPFDLLKKQSQLDIKECALNSVEELFEAVKELKNAKKHRMTDVSEFNREHFVEECVDSFKFFLEFLIFVGVDADEFFKAYAAKDAVINKRLDDGY